MDYIVHYPCGLGLRDIVGMGNTALVGRLDAVVKFADQKELKALEIEKRVYQRLGRDCDEVLRYYGGVENAIILQYACNGSIREYLTRQVKPNPISLQLRWAEQITTSIVFIHSRNVLHGDICCNNIFLDENLDARLGDFAGSSIDGEMPLVCYETSHEHPEMVGISIKSEVFAVGSTLYEIMTGSKPYKELSDQQIRNAYRQGNFPSLTSLAAFSNVISKCWNQRYATVDELLEDVKAESIITAFSI
jgi:serine/threonine protein kinase